MAEVLIVADDLTGANATGAGFSRAGLRAVTVGSGQRWGAATEFHDRFDVIVVSTDSRHADRASSAARVDAAVRAGWPVRLVGKRIDTTLRGNIGVEAAAALRAVAELSGRRVVGLCLPAHPAAGRHTVDGTQLLQGRRLEETELARDPRSPVRTSMVAEVLAEGTDLATAHVRLPLVTGAGSELTAALRTAVADGTDVVIGDALTEEHLDRVATAAARLATADPELLWVAIDPGPGSVALARALGIRDGSHSGPILAVSGSATALTRAQLQRLTAERPVTMVRPVPARPGRPVPDVDATAAAVCAAVARAGVGDVVLLAGVLTEADMVELDRDEGELLPRALGRITRRVLATCTVDGLFTTGGDVTAAVLDELGARGLEVDDEIVPLAVAGSVVGGRWSGLPVVTKGGLVGDPGTTVRCLDHLAVAAQQRRRRVRAARPVVDRPGTTA